MHFLVGKSMFSVVYWSEEMYGTFSVVTNASLDFCFQGLYDKSKQTERKFNPILCNFRSRPSSHDSIKACEEVFTILLTRRNNAVLMELDRHTIAA